jgi:hypothetical protein
MSASSFFRSAMRLSNHGASQLYRVLRSSFSWLTRHARNKALASSCRHVAEQTHARSTHAEPQKQGKLLCRGSVWAGGLQGQGSWQASPGSKAGTSAVARATRKEYGRELRARLQQHQLSGRSCRWIAFLSLFQAEHIY